MVNMRLVGLLAKREEGAYVGGLNEPQAQRMSAPPSYTVQWLHVHTNKLS